MPFALASIQSVKSTNQRALVEQWNRLSAGRGFPDISEFRPPEHDLKQLIVWDVERDGNRRRFRMRQFGRFVAESTDLPLAPGKTMDEVVPEPLRTFALEAANECADSGCATYSVLTTIAPNGNLVDCERLLMPFGRNGEMVEQLVAMLQLISYQGAVDRHGIASEFEAKSSVGLSVAIAADPADEAAVASRRQRLAAVVAPPLAPGTAETPAEPVQRTAEHRHSARRNVNKTGRIRVGRLNEICVVRNISAEGAALELAGVSKIPDTFTLVLEMESTGRPCSVVWRSDKQLGVKFG